MKRLHFLVWILLFVALICSSCAPQVYGQQRRRKVKNCGCEWIKPQKVVENETLASR